MNRRKLIILDKSLNVFQPAQEILSKKRGLFIYYNKPNRKTKLVKIHKHFCGQCAWASGKMGKKNVGKNGVWVGPFSEMKFVEQFLKDNFHDLIGLVDKTCSCLKAK